MSQGVQNKIALVTGAARGIGRSIALELAAQGADLVVNDFQSDAEAKEVAAVVEGMGRRAIVCSADISDAFAVESMFKQIDAGFGTIDILVNNAAFSVRKPFVEMSLCDVERTWGVTQRGTFLCSQHAAQRMLKQGRGGSIVMISSVHAERPYPSASAYNAAKAGVNHMAQSMALELAGQGIRVNVVEPGWIDTPGERQHNSATEIEERGRTLPMKRLGTPQEVAKAVAFLCSEDASYITGATLRVDGGFALKF